MNLNVLAVKYSIFGRYDFIDDTPENVSKLYEGFGKDGFMPNMVTLLKIEQPQNTVTQILRPQLINKSMPCTITILPERIDIEAGTNVELKEILLFFERIKTMFELEISRIALNKTTILENLTKNEEMQLKVKLTPPENYYGEENLIEYASHRVTRKKLDCIGEMINVGRNITGLSSVVEQAVVIDRIQIDTDINTLGEILKDRFGIEQCQGFFECALESDQDILDNVVRIIDAD